MTTLHLVLDEMLTSHHSAIASYTSELAAALIDYAPTDCYLEGLVAASPEPDYGLIAERLPGLRALFKSALTRRDLTTAWQHGFTPVPSGIIHAPSLFAPLRAHDRAHARGSQIAVGIHSVRPWSHPEMLAPRQVSWAKAMGQRALKYADAVVVPTHAVATELAEFLPFGERIRVIGGAVRSSLRLPDDADERADRLELPSQYLLAFAPTRPDLANPLLAALDLVSTELPVLMVGETDVVRVETGEGNASARIRFLGELSDGDLSVALKRATAFVHTSPADGFGTTILEAFSLGTPVIHSDAPSLVEVAGDAGYAVTSGDAETYPAALAEAIDRVVEDDDLRATMSVLGADRARLFTWRSTAEAIWQLHADL